MSIKNHCFTLTLVLTIAGLGTRSTGLRAAPPVPKFENRAEWKFSGGTSGTGIKDKGGFTVVTIHTAKDRTKLAVSFAFHVGEKRNLSDFQLIAVDAAGKQHRAKAESSASAAGKGIVVVTMVAEFSLASDKIDSLVIRQLVRKEAASLPRGEDRRVGKRGF